MHGRSRAAGNGAGPLRACSSAPWLTPSTAAIEEPPRMPAPAEPTSKHAPAEDLAGTEEPARAGIVVVSGVFPA